MRKVEKRQSGKAKQLKKLGIEGIRWASIKTMARLDKVVERNSEKSFQVPELIKRVCMEITRKKSIYVCYLVKIVKNYLASKPRFLEQFG